MDALRKLRESVSKQQQYLIKPFYGSGYESSDVMVIDEVEKHIHHQLEKLSKSTRSGKDFQREIVKAAEAYIVIGYKNIEAGTKLSEDCCKYGAENINDNVVAKAAAIYGDARKHVEKEQEDFIKLLSSQVTDPLRAIIAGSHVEDARHLSQRYSQLRYEAETLTAELNRRQIRRKEFPTAENTAKLQMSETKMQELKKNMALLGKEVTTAMSTIGAQQQRLAFQRLVAMVEGEKSYHLRVAAILGEVEAEIAVDKQMKDSAPPMVSAENCTGKTMFFLAEATHPFSAEAERELSLSKGDYVVVRKVSPGGWSEGECNGKAGWFPSAYVEKRQSLPAINVDVPTEDF